MRYIQEKDAFDWLLGKGYSNCETLKGLTADMGKEGIIHRSPSDALTAYDVARFFLARVFLAEILLFQTGHTRTHLINKLLYF